MERSMWLPRMSLRWSALGIVLLLALVLACGPAAAPTATPTVAAPAATATKAPVVAAPTATATPAPTVAPKRGGKITWVIAAEPLTMSVSAIVTSAPISSLSDPLIYRNAITQLLQPVLVEKWENIDAKTWRFYLRKDVKFWNGEVMTPEGLISDLEWQSAPDNKTGLPRYVKSATGKVIDPYTLNINCSEPCPLLPSVIFNLRLQAPAWAKANPDLYKSTTMGNGPYKLAEYKRGEYYKLTRFEEYWGAKSFIDEATVVWRGESKVRAAMVATGEANVATDIKFADRNLVPKTVPVGIGVENDVIKLNDRSDPVLKDKRVRKALAYAIDRETITKTLFGGFTKPKDMPFGPGSVGWTDDPVTKYPYDPAKARQLIKEAGMEGGKVTAPTAGATDSLQLEIFQAILGYWDAVGLKTQLVATDEKPPSGSNWNNPGVGATFPYSVYFLSNHTNALFDASITLPYADCREAKTISRCDPTEQAWLLSKLVPAQGAIGAERQEKLAELMKWFQDEVFFISLWGSPHIHGLKADTEYKPTSSLFADVIVADVRLLN